MYIYKLITVRKMTQSTMRVPVSMCVKVYVRICTWQIYMKANMWIA